MSEDASLYSCGLAALAAFLPDKSSSSEAAFLRSHAAAVEADGTWKEALDRILQSAGTSDAPILKLAEQLALRPVETLAVTLAASVEADLMCGRAIAHLQAPVGGSRPTLGLLAAAFAELEPERNIIECLLTGKAVKTGLLQLLNESCACGGARRVRSRTALPGVGRPGCCVAWNQTGTRWRSRDAAAGFVCGGSQAPGARVGCRIAQRAGIAQRVGGGSASGGA